MTADQLDLDGLEGLARAATPGEWRATKHPESYFTDAIKADGRLLARCQALFGRSHVPTADIVNNAAYIAAANPAVVLSLITRLRASEAATASLKAGVSALQDLLTNSKINCDGEAESVAFTSGVIEAYEAFRTAALPTPSSGGE